jgi:hypothetical protein
MDHVNAILAQVSPAETRQLCQRAAADIDDRIGIENRLAQAQSSVWRGEDGKPIAETESMKSQSDFAGSMLLTTDEDWQEKWNTPPETEPHYNQANVVPYGKKVFTMIFFSNPLRDAEGMANMKCGLKISDPSGKVSSTSPCRCAPRSNSNSGVATSPCASAAWQTAGCGRCCVQ